MRREFTLQLYDRTGPPDAIPILPFWTNSVTWETLTFPRIIQPGERAYFEVIASDGRFQMRLILGSVEVVRATYTASSMHRSAKLGTQLGSWASASTELTIQVRAMSITEPVCIHSIRPLAVMKNP